MLSEFPKLNSSFLTAKSFQDQKLTLTFKGWERRSNEDRPAKGKMAASTWKQNLKYQLRYSYPEFAIDEAGEKIFDEQGNPKKNGNYDPAYPHGYSIVYHFEEGLFESGSYPLFKAFCLVRPANGDRLVIGKTGKDKETVWEVKKIEKNQSHSASSESDVPDINYDEPGNEEPPF